MNSSEKYIEFVRDPDVKNRYQTIGILLIVGGLGVAALPLIDPKSASLTSYVGSIIMLTMGVAVYFTRTKVQFDLNEQRVRTHNHLFGFRFGKWEPLSKFNFITIRARKVGYNNHRGMRAEITETRYEVMLLTGNKRGKYLLLSTEDELRARSTLNTIEEAFPFDIA